MSVVVRYFAGARAASGLAEEVVDLGPGQTLDGVLAELRGRHGAQLERVLTSASYLVDGQVAHSRDVPLRAGGQVDVLPPFAGG